LLIFHVKTHDFRAGKRNMGYFVPLLTADDGLDHGAHQCCQPLAITNVSLVTRHIFDVLGIDHQRTHAGRLLGRIWAFPVNFCAFHYDLIRLERCRARCKFTLISIECAELALFNHALFHRILG